MTIIRNGWHDVFPAEPPGVYAHVTDGSPCWCKPVILGNVVLHRPWSECKAEIMTEIAKRATQA